MPVYNAAKTIRAAVVSVCRQTNSDWELIIVDGGSTDDTLTVLDEFAAIPAIRWLSEPDQGIYDAMNKGIGLATGEWLYFLGSDDQLADQALALLRDELSVAYKVVFGDVLFENGHRMRSFIGSRTWLQNTVHHQSAFYHRSLFGRFRYDPTLRLLADYELNLTICQQQWPTHYVEQVIAVCHSGGASSNWTESLKETNLVRGRLLTQKWKQTLLSATLRIYYVQKQLRRALYGHKV